MELRNVTFSTSQIAKLTGVHEKTIANYCRWNHISCIRSSDTGNYHISGAQFMEFLYTHPTLLSYTKKTSHGAIVDYILKTLSTRERVYAATDVAEMFQVTKQTIWNWVNRGYLVPFSYEKFGMRNPTFRERDLKQLVDNVPRLRIFYTGYNRRKKVS